MITATIGIGITGGIPVPISSKRENTIEILVEQKDDYDDDKEINLYQKR
jgi:hypothetical protein